MLHLVALGKLKIYHRLDWERIFHCHHGQRPTLIEIELRSENRQYYDYKPEFNSS